MVKCFWCNVYLTKDNQTKDHLICKFIRKTFNYSGGNTVPACKKCNGTRGGISSLFQIVHYLNNGILPANWSEKIFLKSRSKHYNRMVWFRDIIKNKVTGKTKEYCLREIDTIILYQPKS